MFRLSGSAPSSVSCRHISSYADGAQASAAVAVAGVGAGATGADGAAEQAGKNAVLFLQSPLALRPFWLNSA